MRVQFFKAFSEFSQMRNCKSFACTNFREWQISKFYDISFRDKAAFKNFSKFVRSPRALLKNKVLISSVFSCFLIANYQEKKRKLPTTVAQIVTVITKRNTINKENLTNENFLLTYKKGLLSYKQDLLTYTKKDLLTNTNDK